MEPTPEQLLRLLNGSHSEQDQVTLRSWLAEDKANLGIWEDYQQLWQRYGDFAAELIQQHPPRPAEAWQRLQEAMEISTVVAAHELPWRRFSFGLRAIAAVVALLVAVGGGWWVWQQGEYEVLAQETMLRHTFPDGSVATLRPGSQLRYGRKFNRKHRALHLTGEAYFEVQRNKDLPFVVHGQAGAVEVIGTSFLVETGSKDSLLLTVYTGVTALFGAESPQQRTVVSANETAVITPNGVAMRSFRTGRLAWKTGQLQHQAAPLAELLADLEHWYGVPIRCTNEGLLRCPITIALENEKVETALAAVAAVFDMKVEAIGERGFLLKEGHCSQ